jgi:predicted nucleic acid-binding protein
VAFLFDTDAISEVLRRRPSERYVAWLRGVPRAEQFTSAVVVGELFKGAYRSPDAPRHLRNIETRVLPALTVLSYDVDVARAYGALRAQLEESSNSRTLSRCPIIRSPV